jgi:anti-sigma factor ChrR (cupin superfamily)
LRSAHVVAQHAIAEPQNGSLQLSEIFGTAADSAPRAPFVARADREQEWEQSSAEGFLVKTLFSDPATGDRTLLMQYAPGAYAGPHSHDQIEHVYVLDGSFTDEYGSYGKGDYLMRVPGAVHSARTDEGATVLLLYTRP